MDDRGLKGDCHSYPTEQKGTGQRKKGREQLDQGYMHVHVHVNEEIPKRNSKQLSPGFLYKVTGEHQNGQGC